MFVIRYELYNYSSQNVWMKFDFWLVNCIIVFRVSMSIPSHRDELFLLITSLYLYDKVSGVYIIEGSRTEWTNPQIEDGKMPKHSNKNYTYRKGNGVKFQ